jgi:ribosomal protein L34E
MWEITIMPEYMSGRDSGGGAYGKVKCSRCVEEMIKKSWKFF